jgi:hypothetical protein
MRKFILMLVLITCFSDFKSQNVGISTAGSAPRDCAMLDIVSSTKGLLIPTFTLTSSTSYAPATGTPVDGLLVYNTNTIVASGLQGKGFYYWYLTATPTPTSGAWVLLCANCGSSVTAPATTSSKVNSENINQPSRLKEVNFASNNLKETLSNSTEKQVYQHVSVKDDLILNGNVKFENGIAEVLFDENIRYLYNLSSFIITATPMGNCNGVYIDEITEKGFKIKELRKGKSNVKVNFMVWGMLKSLNSSIDE